MFSKFFAFSSVVFRASQSKDLLEFLYFSTQIKYHHKKIISALTFVHVHKPEHVVLFVLFWN